MHFISLCRGVTRKCHHRESNPHLCVRSRTP
jgi:hypothetical protein